MITSFEQGPLSCRTCKMVGINIYKMYKIAIYDIVKFVFNPSNKFKMNNTFLEYG